MEEYRKELLQEVEDFYKENKWSSSYIKRKLVIWCVRTLLSAILYVIFWKYEWVRWTLLLYIPLAIFNLIVIIRFNSIIDKKTKELRSRINKIE